MIKRSTGNDARGRVPRGSGRIAAVMLAGLSLMAGLVVALAPAASAKARPRCGTPHSAPLNLTLADGGTVANGTVTWTCRSVNISGTLEAPAAARATSSVKTTTSAPTTTKTTSSNGSTIITTTTVQRKVTTLAPAKPVEVCVGAQSLTQRFGKLVLKLQQTKGKRPTTVVCTTSGHPVALNFGYQRPKNAAGDVNTITVHLGQVVHTVVHGKAVVEYPRSEQKQKTYHQPVF